MTEHRFDLCYYIEQLEDIAAKAEPIPVTQRWPVDGQRVEAYPCYGRWDVAIFDRRLSPWSGLWWHFNGIGHGNITHWRPMPDEPWKGE